MGFWMLYMVSMNSLLSPHTVSLFRALQLLSLVLWQSPSDHRGGLDPDLVEGNLTNSLQTVRPRQGGGGAAPAFHSQEALPSGGPEGSAPAFKRSSPGVTRATFTHSSLARVSPVTSQKDQGSSKCSTAMYPGSTELGNVGETLNECHVRPAFPAQTMLK